ncbi:envelope stress response membrane protein PspB [Sphingomonas solaris]|uniref:Envelope stress response membrane protein PspB n=1 Tax=Alterirhizorhabdus solaris TaxID=2529389 RepID=A0A558R1X1_9SPHN|nr:envelope stress response membrane protein PspB [Sphingomonas solaris]TVV73367.1 envelope stress response membrane protein PspB [Sphingomonas solaris]
MDVEGILAISLIFLGLPWLLFHYITQWKRAGGLSVEDENLLDELHELARRLDERLRTIERIVAADDPAAGVVPARPADWRDRADR